jgi:hypothetical protein
MEAAGHGAEPQPFRTRLRQYCDHAAAREIRMYTSYADANAVRLRLQAEGGWRHVSALYEIPNGWAWTLCDECPAANARSARRTGSADRD